MLRSLFAAILIALTAAAASSQKPVQSIVESERSFAKRALEVGIGPSFLEYMTDDAWIVSPYPMRAKDYYTGRKPDAAILEWAPNFADAASDGSFGYTTGNWQYREKKGAEPTAFGEFNTIWVKQSNGNYKWVVDLGIGHDKPSAYSTEVVTAEATGGRHPSPPSGDMGTFELQAGENVQKAYATFASNNIRMLRRGKLPIVGPAAVQGRAFREDGIRDRYRVTTSERYDIRPASLLPYGREGDPTPGVEIRPQARRLDDRAGRAKTAARKMIPQVSQNIHERVHEILEIEAAAIHRAAENLKSARCIALDRASARVHRKGRRYRRGQIRRHRQKISQTLTSTGTASVFVHPSDALHGGLGVVSSDDVVIALSNSGETDELLAIMPSIRQRGCKVISILGNQDSTLAAQSEVTLDASVEKEACPLNLAPTASTTVALAIGDALAMALMEAKGLTQDEFAVNHPAGRLGKRLTVCVRDLMHQSPTFLPRPGGLRSYTRFPSTLSGR